MNEFWEGCDLVFGCAEFVVMLNCRRVPYAEWMSFSERYNGEDLLHVL